MGIRFCILILGVSALAVAQQQPGAPPPAKPPAQEKPAGGAAQPTPNAADKPVVAMDQRSAQRGEAVTIRIPSAPDSNDVTVKLGGSTIAAVWKDKTLTFEVPQEQALGSTRVSIVIGGRAYPVAQMLAILASSTEPTVDSIQPSTVYATEHRVEFGIFGRGFSTTLDQHPDDIKLLVNKRREDVVWHPKWAEAAAACRPTDGKYPADIHGTVVSSSEIRVCNIEAPDGFLPIGLFQGAEVPSKADGVTVTSWNPWLIRGVSFAAAAGLIFLVYVLLGLKGNKAVDLRPKAWWHLGDMFIDKQTNTYSLSVLQFHMWTAATLFGYSYFALARLFVQRGVIPEAPGVVPAIVGIGIGAGTAVAAQMIGSVNPKGAGEEHPAAADLVTSGGAIAPDRVQMLVWTFIGVSVFIAGVLREAPATMKQLPAIPESLMALMGLSSIGYLGGKFARKAGPNIIEASITPATAAKADTLPQAAPVDLSQPVKGASETLDMVKRAAAGLSETSAPAAVREANAAVTALKGALEAAQAVQGSGGPTSRLVELADAAHNAAVNAAGEFERSSGNAGVEIARVSANLAQRAAAAAFELRDAVGSAVAQAQASAAKRAEDESRAFRRIVEFRGTNLSAEAAFRAALKIKTGDQETVEEHDLPFRMLERNEEGRRVPEILQEEENKGGMQLCRVLRLNIVPSELGGADRETYDKVFGTANADVTFIISNPDGQKATKTVKLPPGEAQRP